MERTERFLNVRYALIQTAYWGIFCALNGYAAVYLDGKGFTAGQTGVMMALVNIFAALLQPAVAAKADKEGRISLKELVLLLSGVSTAALALLIAVGNGFKAVSILFFVALVSQLILQPLVNAVGMYYINRGEKVNFGFARGIGSVAYALVSYLAGALTGKYGVTVIPVIAVLLFLLFIAISFSFQIKIVHRQAGESAGEDSFLVLFKKYKTFTVFLFGVVIMFIFHFMTNTYMFQMVQNVGGDSGSMGIAVSVAAVCEIPVMVFFDKLVKRVRVETLLRAAAVCWTIKAVAFCFCTNVGGIYAAQVLQLGSFGIYVPASVYYANQVIDEKNQVKAQAMVTTAFTIGSVFGNFLGGKMIDAFGVSRMLIAAAACTAAGTVLFFAGTKRVDKQPEQCI
ncbi:MAG: MFS transporter [Lachnospiraceae bacterium]|nr:MFS transporter [Lachnospiraceae bacterium]